MNELRFPAVSGQMYPLDPGELQLLVDESLNKSLEIDLLAIPDSEKAPKAIVVPHTGLGFSSDYYGLAYRQIVGHPIDEVFILTESIYHEPKEVSFADFQYWQTPLGKVAASPRIQHMVEYDDSKVHNLMFINNEMFNGEYAVELQLPMLQGAVSGDYYIAPMIVPEGTSPRLLSQILYDFIQVEDLVIVPSQIISTDNKEYDEEFNNLFMKSIKEFSTSKIQSLSSALTNTAGLTALMEIARIKGWKPEILAIGPTVQKSPVNPYVIVYYSS